MSVFRVERTRDYTVMSNYHLRDKHLSLKAKGLMSQMLSLPEDWDYTLSGLAHINKESKDAIRTAVAELERWGYIQRHQKTDAHGRFSGNEYVIYEHPVSVPPTSSSPSSEKPVTDHTMSENTTQLNINSSRKETQKKDLSIIDSFSSFPEPSPPAPEVDETEAKGGESILQQLQLDALYAEFPYQQEQLSEIADLLTKTLSLTKPTIRVAGNTFPAEVVKARLRKLTGDHIRFVLECLGKNTTRVRCMKQYLLTALFNAPTTIDNYYAAQVNHDLCSVPPA